MKARIPLRRRLPYAWLTWREMRGESAELSAVWRHQAGTLPEPNPNGILFAACDRAYFDRYALDYLGSFGKNSGGLSAHLHVYDATDAQLASVSELAASHPGLRITATRDAWMEPGLYSPFYFAAGRFVLMAGILAGTESPIICTDVDVVVRGDLRPVLSAFQGDDVALFLRLHNRSPWRKILASTVVAMPTAQGRNFATRLSRAMDLALLRRPRHHVDQLILYYAYRLSRLGALGPIRCARLPRSVVDWELGEESLIWNLKGSRRKAARWTEASIAPR